MKLYCRKNDYRTQKVLIAADYAGVTLDLDYNVEKIPELCDPAKAPLLETDDQGHIFQSNAILRYISSIKADSALYGVAEFQKSQVDQWLDFSWTDIELPLAVQAAGAAGSSADAVKRASKDLERSLGVLNGHLKGNTFIVGERVSAADIALACALVRSFTGQDGKALAHKFSHVTRWFFTCMHQPVFIKVIGKVLLGSGAEEKDAKGGKTKGQGKAVSAAPASKSTGSAPLPPASKGAASTGVTDGILKSSNVLKNSVAPSSLFKRNRIRIRELLAQGLDAVDSTVTVKGWCKTLREGGKGAFAFVELNDGSCFANLQIVVNSGETKGFQEVLDHGGVGASFAFVGVVVKSPAKGQLVELKATEAEVLGGTDKAAYPLAKKRHTLEFLREIAHLRPRSNFHGAAMRVRNAMAYATHKFFNDRGFYYIHTPLITASDCEGAGEMFAVTTLLPKDAKQQLPRGKDGAIDYHQDFFSKQAFLTVSGQLNVETHSCALGDCYTFGPTFRAENSHTSRHLAEFWMIEPEISFADLNDDINLAEDYVKYLVQWALDNCREDLAFFEERVEKGLIKRLENVLAEPFARIDYTEAINLVTDPKVLKAANFERVPKWGDDLGSEHERYITEKIYKKPVVVKNYPKDIKAFYMRLNDDNKTVAAADILVPGIGELIGGSQREERMEVLEQRCKEMDVHIEGLQWYLDLRRYGSVPHAGFGLGFERLIQFVTGIENIRDVIAFPRWPGNVNF